MQNFGRLNPKPEVWKSFSSSSSSTGFCLPLRGWLSSNYFGQKSDPGTQATESPLLYSKSSPPPCGPTRSQRIVQSGFQFFLAEGASDLRIVEQRYNLPICEYPDDVSPLQIRNDLRISSEVGDLRALPDLAKAGIF